MGAPLFEQSSYLGMSTISITSSNSNCVRMRWSAIGSACVRRALSDALPPDTSKAARFAFTYADLETEMRSLRIISGRHASVVGALCFECSELNVQE
jgi:hypothetical protein